jgi:hypothetical protein
MKPVTHQASGSRHRPCTRVVSTAPPDCSWRIRGAQSASATSANTDHSVIVVRQSRPVACSIGTVRPAAAVAPPPSATEYAEVITTRRSGKSRLIKPGTSTFPTAIPAPITAAPRNRVPTEGSSRSA